MNVLIVNGGSLTTAFLAEQYQQFNPDCVIAVDGALALFYQTGLKVTHIVGDFDTIAENILQCYQEKDYVIERHKPEKDETDSELAMELALAMEPDEILVLGAMGFRMDHALANLQLLYRPLQAGIFCRITDEYNEIRLIEKTGEFTKDNTYKYLSFIPFTDQVEGLTLEGFKYSLSGYLMKKGIMPGFCVSNEMTKEQAKVTLDSGILICVRSRDR